MDNFWTDATFLLKVSFHNQTLNNLINENNKNSYSLNNNEFYKSGKFSNRNSASK